MNIVTYRRTEPGAAPEFLAYILTGGEFLPARFSGATDEAARSRAQTHWDEAMAKQAKVAAKAKPRAAPGPTEDDNEEAV